MGGGGDFIGKCARFSVLFFNIPKKNISICVGPKMHENSLRKGSTTSEKDNSLEFAVYMVLRPFILLPLNFHIIHNRIDITYTNWIIIPVIIIIPNFSILMSRILNQKINKVFHCNQEGFFPLPFREAGKILRFFFYRK